MVVIKDAMVIIHLAKITILEKSCEYFKKVIIPLKVYDEIMKGNEKGYIEIPLIIELIEKNKITIKNIENNLLLKKAQEFNIQEGEGEALALYWQEKANYLATDDDNVRKKSSILGINIVGTPSIILALYKNKMINAEKFTKSVLELKKIGWFSNAVIDKMLMEVK